jgi:hypothetical protein
VSCIANQVGVAGLHIHQESIISQAQINGAGRQLPGPAPLDASSMGREKAESRTQQEKTR